MAALRRRCLAGAVVVTLLAACSARASITSAPVVDPVRVGAQPFALAEVARRVGLDRIVVADRGAVMLTTGGDTDPWLDPVAMQRVTRLAAAILSHADPPGRSAYQAAARAYAAQLGALDIDFRSSLADCGRHDIVTADRAFAPLAQRYGFTDHAATEAGIAPLVKTKGIPVVFTEPGVATGPVEALARATHTRVERLDTLTLRTTEEAASGATYLSLMANNLAKLRTALACTSNSDA